MMSDKIVVLLKLSTIMKQQAEKKLADAMFEIRKISENISNIHQNIDQKHLTLFESKEPHFIQSDVTVFEQWKQAQLKRLVVLQQNLATANLATVDLLHDLKTQTVRQDMLTAQLKKSQAILADEKDELANERNLEGWLNQQRYI